MGRAWGSIAAAFLALLWKLESYTRAVCMNERQLRMESQELSEPIQNRNYILKLPWLLLERFRESFFLMFIFSRNLLFQNIQNFMT